MKIGIIDADLLGKTNHRFPNLACMKISGYWKNIGAEVILLMDYKWDDTYDHIYISKVFTDTPVPEWVDNTETVHLGGTGFYFDRAPSLPYEIEHHMPDYELYNVWIETKRLEEVAKAEKSGKKFNKRSFETKYKEYLEYSIGFLTRGCFRKCQFCVNQKYDTVEMNSPLFEFYSEDRKKICLLDDNFFGCPQWKQLLQQLIDTGKPFKFKQGLDERLLTDEKCEMLLTSKYDKEITFAFDNIDDYDIIREKLKLISKYGLNDKVKFYVLVGFDSVDAIDIENIFKRIKLLMEFGCLPYIMKYAGVDRAPWKESEYKGMYTAIARWVNQPSFFKKKSLREYCELDQKCSVKGECVCASMRAIIDFENKHPEIADKYFDMKYENIKTCTEVII